MAFWSKLFGGRAETPAATSSETYKGFQIIADPMKEAQGYRIAATITKTVDGVEKTHRLVRADTINALDEAEKASVAKAQQMIDEQGERLFG